MALIPTVTKVSVTGSEENTHSITLNLKVHDNVLVEDVIDKNFIVEYKTSHDSRDVLMDRLIRLMQNEIDTYKSHKVLADSSALSNDIITIQTNLVV